MKNKDQAKRTGAPIFSYPYKVFGREYLTEDDDMGDYDETGGIGEEIWKWVKNGVKRFFLSPVKRTK